MLKFILKLFSKLKLIIQHSKALYLKPGNKHMKDSFIPDDLQTANESLMKKIQYLTSQKNKSQAYIKDMEESLKINKEAVRIINSEGPNNQAIAHLAKDNLILQKRVHSLYNENRDLNALLLFQSQIRLQDKSFYQERVVQFQNRISDLRKYLHDKEDSFSNVVNRLKKYEDINEMMIVDKMASLKGEFNNANSGNDSVSKQILMKLTEQKNRYKAQYEILLSKIQNGQKISQKIDQPLEKVSITNQSSKKYPINPNKQLIRLLKKQKISNQILQQALNDAIQKNQQLISYNEKLYDANLNYLKINSQLRAFIVKLEGKLANFQQNYERKRLNKTKCDLDIKMYQRSIQQEIKLQQKIPFQQIMPKGQLKKMKRDLDKISIFMPGSKNLPDLSEKSKEQFEWKGTTATEEKIRIAKSASQAKLGKQQMSDQEIEIDYL